MTSRAAGRAVLLNASCTQYLSSMSSADLFLKINSLPAELRKLVADYVEFLSWRKEMPMEQQQPPNNKTPIPGLLKGKIWIADDFDAPLDDFKEYME